MKKHILIVDDNQIDVRKIQAIVENDGHIPVVAKDAYAAIEMSRYHRFDLAIIDLQMPNMNGFKLTEILKDSTETKALPILIMSGSYKTEEDVKNAVLSGASDFILKPIDPLMLSAKMSRIMTNRVDWGEWSLANSGISPFGSVRVNIEVLSISEMGLRILCSVALKIKSSPQISIPLLDKLEIPTPNLQVLECVKTNEGFSCYVTFIGLPETHLQKIRIFCRKLSANNRTVNKSY